MYPTAPLHALSEFIDQDGLISNLIANSVTYWYEGRCPRSHQMLRLPRTVLAERVAHGLMEQIAAQNHFSEGKMYGVLLVAMPTGEQRVLQAFSGLLQGKSSVEGWVPSISGRDRVALEEVQTLASLDAIKQELITLQQISERQQYEILAQEFETKLSQLNATHRECKQERLRRRQQILELLTGEPLALEIEQLNQQSRQEGIARRRLKQARDAVLQPLQQVIDQANARIHQLKLRRKTLSRHLQAQLHGAYRLTNFAGESASIQQLTLGGLPTGTGDCCAPKLLHYAATHDLMPLALAEFWWGSATVGKVSGEFYGACVDRCQPILGFLLSGLPPSLMPPSMPQPTTIADALFTLYEDDWLIAINKPAGLLSVPGRCLDRQDSVLSRLGDYSKLMSVHRLDQDTSGILLLAKDRATHRALSHQFQQRQIEKKYEAILAGIIASDQGTVDLPLRSDPTDRPRQTVDLEGGKLSLSHFWVMARAGSFTRMEWMPITGRTHQIRVHAATGLGAPIWGDRLYGNSASTNRLHLHARELRFLHPCSGQPIHLKTATPF